MQKQLQEANNSSEKVSENNSLLRQEVTEEDIARVVSTWTGIPVSKMMASEMQKYIELEDVLHKRVVGQDEAVSKVADDDTVVYFERRWFKKAVGPTLHDNFNNDFKYVNVQFDFNPMSGF